MHVSRPDERLASLTMPLLQPTRQFKLDREDCLIVCAGFEDRALAVLSNALQAGTAFRVLIVGYLPFIADNRLDEIRRLCEQAGLRTAEVNYDRQNPAGFGAALLKQVSATQGRVVLDVSGMSRLMIVQSLVALASRDTGLNDCVIAYAEATEYPPNPATVEDDLKRAAEDPMHTILLLSSGVFEVTVVPELSSTSIAGGQTRLVAFPTFSADQLTALLNELGPSRLTVVHGIPPGLQNKWRTEAVAKINRLENISHEDLFTSTLDYRETVKALLDLYGRFSDRERLLVSPTGSKMQSVATGLFRAFVDDAQIVYPTPRDFCSPRDYTRGVGQAHSQRDRPRWSKPYERRSSGTCAAPHGSWDSGCFLPAMSAR